MQLFDIFDSNKFTCQFKRAGIKCPVNFSRSILKENAVHPCKNCRKEYPERDNLF